MVDVQVGARDGGHVREALVQGPQVMHGAADERAQAGVGHERAGDDPDADDPRRDAGRRQADREPGRRPAAAEWDDQRVRLGQDARFHLPSELEPRLHVTERAGDVRAAGRDQ